MANLSYSAQIPEIKQLIGHYSSLEDLAAQASTSKTNSQLFKPMLDIRRFLLQVVHGEYDKVKAMLRGNINFLIAKAEVIDYSGRRFFNISGFQYALWALDNHMWIKMLNCLPRNEEGAKVKAALLKQYQELKENGITYELNGERITEKHFDFKNTLIKELRTQVNDYNNGIKDWDEVDQQWREGVGSAQKLLPMHVVYEYCSEEPFRPLPAFIEQPGMQKQFYNCLSEKYEDWFHADSKLGRDFGITKGARARAGRGRESSEGASGGALLAMETLCDQRSVEFISLASLLKEPLAFDNPFDSQDLSI
ncbi:MAG: F-box protein [Tatlockia sp.]|nr:F-box protein [Tatlockia sp.]